MYFSFHTLARSASEGFAVRLFFFSMCTSPRGEDAGRVT